MDLYNALSNRAINLYFDKKTNTSSNKVAKLGHRTSIHIGNFPKYKDDSKLYILKFTKIESNKYPTTEIENTINVNLLLFCEFMKTKNKKIRPQIKTGEKLLYKISPKTHINQVN